MKEPDVKIVLEYGRPQRKSMPAVRAGLLPLAIAIAVFAILIIPKFTDDPWYSDNSLFFCGCLAFANFWLSLLMTALARGRYFSAAAALLSVFLLGFVAWQYRTGPYRW